MLSRVLPALLIVLSAGLFAQQPYTVWMETFGWPSDDKAFDVYLEADGNLVLGGSVRDGADRYYYLVRTDQDGNVLASGTYGPYDGSLNATRMAAMGDGGYIFIGTIDGLPPYTLETDIHLVRVAQDLSFRWVTRVGSGPNSEYAASLVEKPNGDLLIAGYRSYPNTSWDVVVHGTDSTGFLFWTVPFPFAAGMAERPNDIIPTSDGNFLICGEAQDPNSQFAYDMLVMKIDPLASPVWTVTPGEPYPLDEEGRRVVETSDGGYLVAGVQSDQGLNAQVYVVKTDAGGTTEWTDVYGGPGNDVANSAIELAGGGYAVCGVHKTTTWKSLVMRYDANGDTLWTYRWGDDLESTYAYDLVELPDGDLIVVGTTTTDSSGVDLFMARVHGTPMGVEDRSDADASLAVRPNPTRETAELVVTLARPSTLTVRLIDLSGRILFTQDLGQRPAGSTLVPVNVSDLEAGTYQWLVTTGTRTTSIPLVVQ